MAPRLQYLAPVMSTGIYVSYSGADANLTDLEVIANNIANVSTAGFRRDSTHFDTVLAAATAFASVQQGAVDRTPGAHQLTGSRLHAAIDGPGFFAVQGPDGEELYTRRGDFRLNARGELVLPSGLPVLGSGGPIAAPPGVPLELRGDGSVATPEGPVGRLRIVRFADDAPLEKRGESLLAAGPGAAPEEDGRPSLAVGFVEGSNVNLAAEMVALIQTTRAFEASMRSLLLSDEMTSSLLQSLNS